MNALESDLTRLPEPAVPAGLAAGINARIARLDAQRAATASEPSRLDAADSRRDRLSWTVALVGATVGLGAQAYRMLLGEATLDLTSLRISGGLGSVIEMPPLTPATAVLAAGLLLYLAGLLAPIRGGN